MSLKITFESKHAESINNKIVFTTIKTNNNTFENLIRLKTCNLEHGILETTCKKLSSGVVQSELLGSILM